MLKTCGDDGGMLPLLSCHNNSGHLQQLVVKRHNGEGRKEGECRALMGGKLAMSTMHCSQQTSCCRLQHEEQRQRNNHADDDGDAYDGDGDRS